MTRNVISIGSAVIAATSLVFAGCKRSVPFEVQRAEMIKKTGNCIWNTDGCDMVYYPTNAPITEASFVSRRLTASSNSKITAISYCPLSSGFGFFTARKAGDFLDRSYPSRGNYNAASVFAKQLNTDALEMASRFARKEGKNFFVSIRMNDTHDGSHSKEKPHPFFSPFKAKHMDCLVGKDQERNWRNIRMWTAVDYSKGAVQEAMIHYIRQFCENYDIDGVELDFNRHAMYFRSTFKGGSASASEVATMTRFMRRVRSITETYGRQRGKPILLLARTDDSIAHDRAVGYDPSEWMADGLIDIWIAGGYTRIDNYDDVVALARKYPKVKVYASIDESRTDGGCGKKAPFYPGRSVWNKTDDKGVPFYAACISAAMASGFDGIWHFNLENTPLRAVSQLDPADTEGVEKHYFATERDPTDLNWHMNDGVRFLKTPNIYPCSPRKMKAGETYSFMMIVGDDFAAAAKKGKTPACDVRLLATGSDKVVVRMNGAQLKPQASVVDPKYGAMNLKPETHDLSFGVPKELVKRGRNAFEVTANADLTLNDFVLDVTYSGKGEGK